MFHARCVFLCVAAAFTLAPLTAYAESPACECSTSSVTATVDDTLGCVTLDDGPLDVCYGNDAVLTLTNDCAFEVVVSGVEDLGGAAADVTIASGEAHTWQQAFTPTLGYDGDTDVSMSWSVEADGASHSVSLTFTGACVAIEGGESGGCQGGSGPTTGWLLALAMAALMASRRRLGRAFFA
jgi:hypothetical protein